MLQHAARAAARARTFSSILALQFRQPCAQVDGALSRTLELVSLNRRTSSRLHCLPRTRQLSCAEVLPG
eukprot:1145165-Pleurochrysis_carterae.AAC.1